MRSCFLFRVVVIWVALTCEWSSGREFPLNELQLRKICAGSPKVYFHLGLRGGKASGLGQQLQQLQFVMKKDPNGYLPELNLQIDNYHEKLKSWQADPILPHKELGELASFLAHMCPNYPQQLEFLPTQMINIIKSNHSTLPAEVRTKFCQSVILMCSRKIIQVHSMCSVFFGLFQLPDKKLRAYLYSACLNAIKKLNAKSVDQKINRQMQRELAEHLHGKSTRSGSLAINLIMELFRQQMWNDDYMVNIIGAACFSPQNKVRGSAIHFLLGIDEELDRNEDELDQHDDASGANKKRIKPSQLMIAKKHKKKGLRKAFREQTKEDERLRLGAGRKRQRGPAKFAVLDRLHDPQAFAERMLALLLKWRSALNFDHKLLMMQLISRLVAMHNLVLPEFLELIMRYVNPHQCDIHHILAILAQAVNARTPCDVVSVVMRRVADRFVSDGSTDEAVTMGLKALGELARRQPEGMEPSLAQELVALYSHRCRSVANAARSLRRVLREACPGLLRRRDRGPPPASLKSSSRGRASAGQAVKGDKGSGKAREDVSGKRPGARTCSGSGKDEGDKSDEAGFPDDVSVSSALSPDPPCLPLLAPSLTCPVVIPHTLHDPPSPAASRVGNEGGAAPVDVMVRGSGGESSRGDEGGDRDGKMGQGCGGRHKRWCNLTLGPEGVSCASGRSKRPRPPADHVTTLDVAGPCSPVFKQARRHGPMPYGPPADGDALLGSMPLRPTADGGADGDGLVGGLSIQHPHPPDDRHVTEVGANGDGLGGGLSIQHPHPPDDRHVTEVGADGDGLCGGLRRTSESEAGVGGWVEAPWAAPATSPAHAPSPTADEKQDERDEGVKGTEKVSDDKANDKSDDKGGVSQGNGEVEGGGRVGGDKRQAARGKQQGGSNMGRRGSDVRGAVKAALEQLSARLGPLWNALHNVPPIHPLDHLEPLAPLNVSACSQTTVHDHKMPASSAEKEPQEHSPEDRDKWNAERVGVGRSMVGGWAGLEGSSSEVDEERGAGTAGHGAAGHGAQGRVATAGRRLLNQEELQRFARLHGAAVSVDVSHGTVKGNEMMAGGSRGGSRGSKEGPLGGGDVMIGGGAEWPRLRGVSAATERGLSKGKGRGKQHRGKGDEGGRRAWGLRNADKARRGKPAAMLQVKRDRMRREALDRRVDPRVERKRHRGHFHKIRRR